MRKELQIQIGLYTLIMMFLAACNGPKEAQQQTGSVVNVGSSASRPKKGIDTAELERQYIDACKFVALEDYNKAVDIFNNIVKIDPNNAPAMYQLGKIFANHGQIGDALAYSEKAASIDPGNRDYQQQYAGILQYSGQGRKAVDVYLGMIKNEIGDEDTYYQLAATYEKLGDRQQAVSTLLDLHKIIGDDEQVMFEIQRLYAAVEQYNNAISWLQKLIKQNPDNTLYLRYLSDYYDRNGQPELAEKTFNDLLAIDPSNTDFQFRKASMQQKAGEYADYVNTMNNAFANPDGNIDTKIFYLVLFIDSIGRPEFKTKDLVFNWSKLLVEAHPDDAKSYAMRGDFLYYDEQLQSAANVYNKSIALRNDVYDVWLKLFYIYSDLHKSDSLALVSNMAIELYPNQPLSYYFAGIAANQQDKFEDAVKVLRRGLPLTISNIDLRSGMFSALGDAYNELKKYPESDDSFENALNLNPNDVYALNNYAYYLSLRKEKLERAAELAKKATTLQPENPSFLDTYGWVLYQQGDYKNAAAWIEKAMQKGGDKSGTVIEHYGDIQYRLGNEAKAMEYWKKAKAAGDASDMLDKKINDNKLYE